jgi:hypothetical protein
LKALCRRPPPAPAPGPAPLFHRTASTSSFCQVGFHKAHTCRDELSLYKPRKCYSPTPLNTSKQADIYQMLYPPLEGWGYQICATHQPVSAVEYYISWSRWMCFRGCVLELEVKASTISRFCFRWSNNIHSNTTNLVLPPIGNKCRWVSTKYKITDTYFRSERVLKGLK